MRVIDLKYFREKIGQVPIAKKPWLPSDYTRAFIVCIGSDPKNPKEKYIQEQALLKLEGRDLSELTDTNLFNNKWQNVIISNIVNHLRTMYENYLFEDYLKSVKKSVAYMTNTYGNILSVSCSSKIIKIVKEKPVIQIFARDSLGIDCFPMYPESRKWLRQNNLPTDERTLISLCKRIAGLTPNLVSRSIEAMFIKRYDWSEV